MYRENTLRPAGPVLRTHYVLSNRSDKYPDGYRIDEVLLFSCGWWVSRSKDAKNRDAAQLLLPPETVRLWAVDGNDLLQYEIWGKED